MRWMLAEMVKQRLDWDLEDRDINIRTESSTFSKISVDSSGSVKRAGNQYLVDLKHICVGTKIWK